MTEVVLDASALLTLLREEPGSKTVETYLDKAVISTVNLSEVTTQLIKYGMPEKIAVATVRNLGLQVMPFDEELAYEAAMLIKDTQKAGLSFGDRACLSLAQNLKAPAITADKAWSKLNINCDIKLIR